MRIVAVNSWLPIGRSGAISPIASGKIDPLNAHWKMGGVLSRRCLPQQNRRRQENLCKYLRP